MRSLLNVPTLAVAATAVVVCLQSAQAITINPIFAPTYTGADYGVGSVVSLDGNVAAENSIIAATNRIENLFTGNLTVNILYFGAHDTTNGFLGANVSGQNIYTYSDYTAALAADSAAHPISTVLSTAVANLGSGNGAGDPLAFVAPTTADARNLGLPDASPQFDATGDYTGGDGTVDAIVFLNIDQPLAFTRPLPDISTEVVYDAQSSMEHETDEVLGVGGPGSTLNDVLQDPTFGEDATGVPGATLYGTEDLYRYSDGLPSYVANPNLDFTQSAYFSIDGGATAVDTFNQAAMAYGDAADWGLAINCPDGGIGGLGFVQDAFSCSNISPDVGYGSPEYIAFQAVGYNVPEPSTWALLLVGFLGIGLMARNRLREALINLEMAEVAITY